MFFFSYNSNWNSLILWLCDMSNVNVIKIAAVATTITPNKLFISIKWPQWVSRNENKKKWLLYGDNSNKKNATFFAAYSTSNYNKHYDRLWIKICANWIFPSEFPRRCVWRWLCGEDIRWFTIDFSYVQCRCAVSLIMIHTIKFLYEQRFNFKKKSHITQLDEEKKNQSKTKMHLKSSTLASKCIWWSYNA